MKEQIRLAILGYGNVGRGVEAAAAGNKDICLKAVFTRRNPESISTCHPVEIVEHVSRIEDYKNELDVVVLCGGSATDLPQQGPELSAMFNTVDSFDTHARIPEYFDRMDKAAKSGANIAVIATGWDPGLFSLFRALGEAVLPDGKDYTFWGKGVSQGHSDAIRRIKGVKDARQYTVPLRKAIEQVRSGAEPELTVRQKHKRECFVVVEDSADKERVEREIKEMPHYFNEYDTEVKFISEEEMARSHAEMPHGGSVIRTGTTSGKYRQIMEFDLKLDSNPGFTGSVLVSYARAAHRLNTRGRSGAVTVFDIAPAYLSPMSPEELRAKLL